VDDLRNHPAREVFADHLRTVKEWSFEEDTERNFSDEGNMGVLLDLPRSLFHKLR
jgi:hypothetical protein